MVGTIQYPPPPGSHRAYKGTVIYIKSTLKKGMPGDVLHHKLVDSAFPNDTTLNQWFTESDFESYRKLGQLIGVSAAAEFPLRRGVS